MRSVLLDALVSPHLLRDLLPVERTGYYLSMAIVNVYRKTDLKLGYLLSMLQFSRSYCYSIMAGYHN